MAAPNRGLKKKRILAEKEKKGQEEIYICEKINFVLFYFWFN